MAGTSPSAPNGREYSILRPRRERGPLTVCELRDGLVVRCLMIVMGPAERFGGSRGASPAWQPRFAAEPGRSWLSRAWRLWKRPGPFDWSVS